MVMPMKDNVFSVLQVLYLSMDNVLEDVDPTNYIKIESVSAYQDLLEEEMPVFLKEAEEMTDVKKIKLFGIINAEDVHMNPMPTQAKIPAIVDQAYFMTHNPTLATPHNQHVNMANNGMETDVHVLPTGVDTETNVDNAHKEQHQTTMKNVFAQLDILMIHNLMLVSSINHHADPIVDGMDKDVSATLD